MFDELERKSIKIKAYIEVNESQYKQCGVQSHLQREKSVENIMTSRHKGEKANQLLNNFHFAQNQTMHNKPRLN